MDAPVRPFISCFWRGTGVYHGLAALGLKTGDNVLVPAYHCATLVEPILRFGCEVKFYDGGLDLTPHFEDIDRKIDRNTRALLIVHYFGFPQPIRRLTDLCRTRGLYLIEECAHVLAGETEDGVRLGDSGDISFFSWRKFLPLYDGGQLLINNPQVKVNVPWETGGLLLSLKIAKNTIEQLCANHAGGWLDWIFRPGRLFSVGARRFTAVNSSWRRAVNINSYETEFDQNCVNLRMSAISRAILKRTTISEIVERRRRTYERVVKAVQGMTGVAPLYSRLPKHVCPWVFPLMVNRLQDAHLKLRARGIPATTWGGVIHPSLILEQFPSARLLYENLVFVPVHQSLEERDLQNDRF